MMSLFCSLPCYSRSAEFMLSYCGHTTCCSYYTSPFTHGEEKDKTATYMLYRLFILFTKAQSISFILCSYFLH